MNDREVAAILAGLRLLQERLTVGPPLPPEVWDILTNDGCVIRPSEIDELCEKINCGEIRPG